MFLPSNITLKFGDSGDFVAELQRRLALVHCYSGDTSGFFDGPTASGVTSFQGMHGLHADGVAGPETLRRLNGVIAGDTGGGKPSENKEEQAQLAQDTNLAANLTIDMSEQQRRDQEIAVQHIHEHEQQAPAPHQTIAGEQQLVQEQQAREHEATQRPAPSNALAAMLTALNISKAAAPEVPAEKTAEPAPKPESEKPVAKAAPSAPKPVEAKPPAPKIEPEPEQPKGLIGKAVRFASEALQRIADRIENKLAPSTLREVQNIGATMARSGVREVDLPTGPEMAGLEKAPARGPEQVEVLQRG